MKSKYDDAGSRWRRLYGLRAKKPTQATKCEVRISLNRTCNTLTFMVFKDVLLVHSALIYLIASDYCVRPRVLVTLTIPRYWTLAVKWMH
jgi:hypothetical protein